MQRNESFDESKEADPSDNIYKVPSQNQIRLEMRQRRIEKDSDSQGIKKAFSEIKQKNKFLAKIYGTQIGISLLVSLLAVAVLYWANPPMTQKKRRSDMDSEKQDFKKVGLAFILILFSSLSIPLLYDLLKNNKGLRRMIMRNKIDDPIK